MLLQKWSYRQYRIALSWLELQWNRPSRTDQYLMQIACEVRRTNVKNPRRVKLDDMKLIFRNTVAAKPASREQAAMWAKAKWLGMMRGPVEVRYVTPDPTPTEESLDYVATIHG